MLAACSLIVMPTCSFWPTAGAVSSAAVRRMVATSAVLGKGKHQYFDLKKPVTNPEYSEPDYFERQAKELEFGPNYIDKLGKIWLERESSVRELAFRSVDNLIQHNSEHWLPTVDPMTPRIGFERVEALKNAPESVKKIFSVGYGNRRDLTAVWKQRIMESVRQHELMNENNSIMTQIAYYTAMVRQLTKLYDELERKPRWLRGLINRYVLQRQTDLDRLRSISQDHFEQLLDRLKIAYHVPPLSEDIPLTTRKGWCIHQCRLKAAEIKENKIRDYHKKVKSDRVEFEKFKEVREKELLEEKEKLEKEIAELESEEDGALPTGVVGQYCGSWVDSVSERAMHADYYK